MAVEGKGAQIVRFDRHQAFLLGAADDAVLKEAGEEAGKDGDDIEAHNSLIVGRMARDESKVRSELHENERNGRTGLREIAETFAQSFTILRGCAREIARKNRNWSL